MGRRDRDYHGCGGREHGLQRGRRDLGRVANDANHGGVLDRAEDKRLELGEARRVGVAQKPMHRVHFLVDARRGCVGLEDEFVRRCVLNACPVRDLGTSVRHKGALCRERRLEPRHEIHVLGTPCQRRNIPHTSSATRGVDVLLCVLGDAWRKLAEQRYRSKAARADERHARLRCRLELVLVREIVQSLKIAEQRVRH
eukprot:Amastigsp_a680227_7.p2 type:complete len:198 gc:universal Amastigsp_a680227_7:1138-1731(+)